MLDSVAWFVVLCILIFGISSLSESRERVGFDELLLRATPFGDHHWIESGEVWIPPYVCTSHRLYTGTISINTRLEGVRTRDGAMFEIEWVSEVRIEPDRGSSRLERASSFFLDRDVEHIREIACDCIESQVRDVFGAHTEETCRRLRNAASTSEINSQCTDAIDDSLFETYGLTLATFELQRAERLRRAPSRDHQTEAHESKPEADDTDREENADIEKTLDTSGESRSSHEALNSSRPTPPPRENVRPSESETERISNEDSTATDVSNGSEHASSTTDESSDPSRDTPPSKPNSNTSREPRNDRSHEPTPDEIEENSGGDEETFESEHEHDEIRSEEELEVEEIEERIDAIDPLDEEEEVGITDEEMELDESLTTLDPPLRDDGELSAFEPDIEEESSLSAFDPDIDEDESLSAFDPELDDVLRSSFDDREPSVSPDTSDPETETSTHDDTQHVRDDDPSHET